MHLCYFCENSFRDLTCSTTDRSRPSMSKKAEHAVRDHRILTRAGDRLGRCSLQRRNAVLRRPDSRDESQVQRDVSERDLQLRSAGSLLHRGRSGAVLLTRTRCPIRPRPEEIHNPKQRLSALDGLPSLLIYFLKGSPDWSPTARTFSPAQPCARRDVRFPTRAPPDKWSLQARSYAF